MSGAAAQNQPDMAMSHEPVPAPLYEVDEKKALETRHSATDSYDEDGRSVFALDLEGEEPTEEDLATLPRVSGTIPWTAFTIAFVELCERFGYYGCQVLCKLRNRPTLYAFG
jgi:POT family proton-dependent oligopeptide transporter